MSDTSEKKEDAVSLVVKREVLESNGITLEMGNKYELILVEQSETISE